MPATREIKWVVLVLLALAAGLSGAWALWGGVSETEAARLMELLQLRPGMTAGEVGAGVGDMTVLLARRLGPNGRVFSNELESDNLQKIRRAVDKAGLSNVTVLQGEEKSAKLPAACCAAIVMRKVYHHVVDPAAMNSSLAEALRPGGRLAVIDFSPSRWRFWLRRPDGVSEDRGGHGVPPEILVREMTAAGLELEKRLDDWPGRNYCAVFRKRDLARPY